MLAAEADAGDDTGDDTGDAGGGAEVGATSPDDVVEACGLAARAAAPDLARASDEAVDDALRRLAHRLTAASGEVLAANAADVAAAEAAGTSPALIDRLRLDGGRFQAMAAQIAVLADTPHPATAVPVRDLPDGLVLLERRLPVGVVGANFEARPNVTVDISSQLLKSRNTGVLRTGSAAIRSATALVERAVVPALAEAGLPPGAVQLVPGADRGTAAALVRRPDLVPLVILRGSGDSTRQLGREAARHGVRVLAHADGGGVLYVDRSADLDMARDLVRRSVDRLGVCNRLNLLLVDDAVYDAVAPDLVRVLGGLGIAASLPPHDHPRGYEWALDDERSATVTVDRAAGPTEAATIADVETSGLAAGIVADDADAAERFLATYTGTGVFWNAPTRLLDGYKLLDVPETGINVDRLPGPRGPVTFRDLVLRQYAVVPSAASPGSTGPRP